MLAHGHQEFITVVANVTNLVHDVLPVLRDFGLEWKIFVVDDPPMQADARKKVFANLGRDVHLLGPRPLYAAYRVILASLRSGERNRRPLIVLPGLMHPAGAVGNACGFIEMVSQVRAAGVSLPHTVFITVSSGTTFAGFLLAEAALRRDHCPPIRIVGVQVYPGRGRLRTLSLIRWTERFLELEGRVPAERIEIVSDKVYRRFGSYTEEHARLSLSLQKDPGIKVDPIFGAKTWSVMESHGSSGIDDRPILYWHCGYTPDWQIVGRMIDNPTVSAG